MSLKIVSTYAVNHITGLEFFRSGKESKERGCHLHFEKALPFSRVLNLKWISLCSHCVCNLENEEPFIDLFYFSVGGGTCQHLPRINVPSNQLTNLFSGQSH